MSNSAPTPDIVIQPGTVIIHVGLPTDEMPLEKIRERKEGGRKLIWILTKDEIEKFTPLGDEIRYAWTSDAQLKRLLHDEMGVWMGAEILPPGPRIERIASVIGELVSLHEFNEKSNTVLSKDNLPTRNCFKNYHWYEEGFKLEKIRGINKGKPCVILAAGPSLNDQWPYLREYRKNHPGVPFLMAGRTYKKAMQEGVYPEFIVEVEQYGWDADLFMFCPEPPPHAVLAFPVTACDRLPKVWPGPKLCLLNHNLAQTMGIPLGLESVDGGNSVLHYMVSIAGIMGCTEMFIAGMDFGYPKGKAEDTHATGTFHQWPPDVIQSEHVHQEGLELPANDGGTIQTSYPYQCFGTYLTVQIERIRVGVPQWGIAGIPDLKVYSFSKRGLKVEGVELKDITEWK